MDTNHKIETIVRTFNMLPHPEGGFYKETYRSKELISKEALTGSFSGDRNYSTAIYFLITEGNFSAFHRIKQDEIWHFYHGDALEVHVIYPDGNYHCHKVSNKITSDDVPQLVVPAGSWFASTVEKGGKYAFVGCTVAPGFDFADFELAERETLLKTYPQYKKVIEQLTRTQ